MDLVVKENFVLHERLISLSEFHAADEVWYFTWRYQLYALFNWVILHWMSLIRLPVDELI